jgi:hypothetical protein
MSLDPSKVIPVAYQAPALYISLTLLMSAAGLIAKVFYSMVRNQFTLALDKLTKIESITSVQAENHLATIQAEAKTTNVLLVGLGDKFDAFANTQAETNGSLRTLVDLLIKKI